MKSVEVNDRRRGSSRWPRGKNQLTEVFVAFKRDAFAIKPVMEPKLSLPGSNRLSHNSDYPKNELKITEREIFCSNFDTGLNKVIKYTEITKIQANGRLGSNTNQTENGATDAISPLNEPQKRPRKTYVLPPTLVENADDNSQVHPLHDFTDSMFVTSGKANNNVAENESTTKRRPLHLPLPRRTSCKFAGNADPTKSGGKPMWNVSSRITTRSASVSSTTLSPVRSTRSSTVPKKPLEVSGISRNYIPLIKILASSNLRFSYYSQLPRNRRDREPNQSLTGCTRRAVA